MKQDSKESGISKDRAFVFAVVVNLGLMLANIMSVLLRLRPNDFKIPIQYIVNDGTIVQSGNWYSLYSILLFVILGGGAIIYIANNLRQNQKQFALATLAIYSLVSIYSLFSINALLGLISSV